MKTKALPKPTTTLCPECGHLLFDAWRHVLGCNLMGVDLSDIPKVHRLRTERDTLWTEIEGCTSTRARELFRQYQQVVAELLARP